MARRPSRQIGNERFTWDPRLRNGVGGYRSSDTGRLVSQTIVNSALTSRIIEAEVGIDKISLQLARSEISLAEWQTGMRDRMKTIYTYSGALAGGGWANMSNNDWLQVARASKFNYRFLQKFALEIQNGTYPITHIDGRPNGRFIQRSRQYGMAGRAVYFTMDRQRAVEAGKELILSVRNVTDSCAGCISQEGLGWMPIGDARIIPIGSRDCLRKCRCTYEYATIAEVVSRGEPINRGGVAQALSTAPIGA